MEVKDELLKDLEGALRLYVDPEKIDCVWVNLDPPGYGQGGIGLDQIATHLASLGYRKVTTCEKCNWNGTCCKALTHNGGDVDFCSQGIPKEEEKSMNTPQTELLKTTASTVDIDFDEWMACACANAKAKFVRKRKEGYTGWTDPALWDVFMKGIHKNLAQVESPDTDASQKADALIDIINFAVMAWRTTKKEAAQ